MLNKPDVQTERLLKLADRIEKSSDFDMANWHKCICGHIWMEMDNTENSYMKCTQDAARYIGLEPMEATRLWGGKCDNKGAAKVLRHLAITGEINWDII